MTAVGPFEAGDDMDSKRPPPLSEGSRFYQRLQRRYADVFASLPSEVPQRESLTQAYTQLRTQGLEVGAALRLAPMDHGPFADPGLRAPSQS